MFLLYLFLWKNIFRTNSLASAKCALLLAFLILNGPFRCRFCFLPVAVLYGLLWPSGTMGGFIGQSRDSHEHPELNSSSRRRKGRVAERASTPITRKWVPSRIVKTFCLQINFFDYYFFKFFHASTWVNPLCAAMYMESILEKILLDPLRCCSIITCTYINVILAPKSFKHININAVN